jgi:hypothetical protein
MDFSVLPGRWGWMLWRIGFIGWWQRHFVRRFRIDRDGQGMRPDEVTMPAPRTFSASESVGSSSS